MDTTEDKILTDPPQVAEKPPKVLSRAGMKLLFSRKTWKDPRVLIAFTAAWNISGAQTWITAAFTFLGPKGAVIWLKGLGSAVLSALKAAGGKLAAAFAIAVDAATDVTKVL